MSWGQAHTVGLGPSLGVSSISSYNRGFPALCPDDSMAIVPPFHANTQWQESHYAEPQLSAKSNGLKPPN